MGPVIVTFKDADVEKLAGGFRVTRFVQIEAVSRRKLLQLKIAVQLSDLRVPPGNRLESLIGGRAGQHSIRIKEEFLTPMQLSNYRVSMEIGVPAQRIGDIISGKRSITADTDLRLCRFFGLANGYWLRAQTVYDVQVAESALGKTIAKIKPWPGSAA